MVRRFLLVLAAALASCAGTATPSFAQSPPSQPEPAVERGMVAVRIANHTECPFAVRLKEDGDVKVVSVVPAHTIRWAHMRPDGVAFELEIAASPKLCSDRAASLDRDRPLEQNVRVRLATRQRPDSAVVAPD